MNIRDVIGVFLILAFIGATSILFYKAIPTENEQLIAYMLGQLSGFVSAVVALHYVTKAGEKEAEQTRAENTGKAFEAVTEALKAQPGQKNGAAGRAADDVVDAATDRAEEIKGDE